MAGIHRYDAKRDYVEPEIKWVLQYVGCIVYLLSTAGVCDLLISCPWRAGFNWLIEIKDPEIGRLKPAQIIFNAVWLGQRGTATTWQEALRILEAPESIWAQAQRGYDLEMLKPVSRRFKKK